MLPDRAARAFPLILLGLLFGLSLTLNRMTELPYFAPGAVQSEPDLTILNFVATEYSPDGSSHYQLHATRMRHYPDDHSELDQARLQRTEPATATMAVTAAKARLEAGSKQVWFENDVLLQRSPFGTTPPMALRTSRLQLDTVTGQAQSEAPVLVQSPSNVLQATGFDYDHKQALLKLRSKVNIDYVPPKR
ncbi:LPS export ABC transporter periplasmic protein LptC [Chitinimonas sp.]|uniref:LPS export ABC transporter periplasmic protein LptC n=1 Tax=Chitinimonas sp. TaxID=1934313 RepID=UPI0035B0AACC